MSNNIIRYRVKYRKAGAAAWLSQLDMARNLERGLRRAGLPLAFTQGFSPHPKISFGTALPLGVESRAEYADIRLTQPLDSQDVVLGLNRCLPETMKIIACRRLADNAPSIGKTAHHAAYKLYLSMPKKNNAGNFKLADNKIFLTNKIIEIKCKEGETKFVEVTEAKVLKDKINVGYILVVTVKAAVSIRPLLLAAAAAEKAAASVEKMVRWEQFTAAGKSLIKAAEFT